MNRKSTVFAIIVVLVLLVAIFGFVFRNAAPEYIQGEAEATEVRISGKVPGRIERFLFNEGDRVERGDTVAILDSPEVMAKYSQAEAAEAAAKALSEKADRGTRSEQIVMAYQTWQKAEAAAEVAKKTYERVERLYELEVVPAQKRDEAEANYNAMVATEKAARSQYEMAKEGARKEDKAAAAALVNQASGAVAEVESYVEEEALTSPIDGEIIERFPEVGELVGTGAPILNIADMNDMWVTFSIREDLLAQIRIGKEIHAFVPALGNQDIVLKVYYMKDMGTYAAWKATKSTGQYDAKTFEVRARPLQPIEGLRPGMSVIWKPVK